MPFKKVESWITLPFLLMSILYLVWFYVVLPIEHYLLEPTLIPVSFLYLPHVVRVLAIWYFGYKAFFGVAAGHVLGFWITTGGIPHEQTEWSIILVGSGSAVAALWLLNSAKLLAPAHLTQTDINWRGIVFLGFFASILNAIGSALIRLDGAPSEEKLPFMLRIVIGDTCSVIVGLLALMAVMRIWRGKSEQYR